MTGCQRSLHRINKSREGCGKFDRPRSRLPSDDALSRYTPGALMVGRRLRVSRSNASIPTLPLCVNTPLGVTVADSDGWTRSVNCNDCGSNVNRAQQRLGWSDGGAVRKRRCPCGSEATLSVISGTRIRETVFSVSRSMASIQPPRRSLAFAADAAGMGFDWCFGTAVLSFYGNPTMSVVRDCAARKRSYTLHALQSKAVSACTNT